MSGPSTSSKCIIVFALLSSLFFFTALVWKGFTYNFSNCVEKLGHEQQATVTIPTRPTQQQTPKQPILLSRRKQRRKFISYTSSKWEKMWLENVDEWTREKTICQQFDFLNLTCTQRHESSGWCIIHDSYKPLFFQTNPEVLQQLIEEHNKNNANNNNDDVPWLTFAMPSELSNVNMSEANQIPVQPGPQDEHIVSKFIFMDEYTGETFVEYIEPLVSHLRHPLASCILAGQEKVYPLVISRSYVIPPPPSSFERAHTNKFYFDAGASSWQEGDGGPSLSYFTTIWGRHGISFDRIEAREMTVDPKEFYATVPKQYQTRVGYRRAAVASHPQDERLEHPFMPREIERLVETTLQQQQEQEQQRDETPQGTYVLFKLDIDSPHVEAGSIQYILEQEERTVDEVVWEHHVRENYLMTQFWCYRGNIRRCKHVANLSLRQSYELFLQLRQRGIRAHSWI